MKNLSDIGLREVQSVYSGPEGQLWELVMGQQIHIGGFRSSMDLADRAGVGGGMSGVDLCCCSGAGMRFLVRFRNVARMQGVDATPAMVELGRRRTAAEGFADRIDFTLADACQTGLPADSADFVWGEDAWCYVVNKAKLVREAVRLTKPRGTIAFTDWMEGPAGLSDAEAERFLRFMKFANVESLAGYTGLLSAARFAPKAGSGSRVPRGDQSAAGAHALNGGWSHSSSRGGFARAVGHQGISRLSHESFTDPAPDTLPSPLFPSLGVAGDRSFSVSHRRQCNDRIRSAPPV